MKVKFDRLDKATLVAGGLNVVLAALERNWFAAAAWACVLGLIVVIGGLQCRLEQETTAS